MISNLVMKEVDEKLESMAKDHGFEYTRYADDLAFSTSDSHNIESIKHFRKNVLSTLTAAGFKQNRRKTMIRGPGSRRIVLGILVDGAVPRLAKEYRDALRQHLYYLKSPVHGPSKHAEARNMSMSTMYHHIRGKIAWAEKIEPCFGRSCLEEFQKVCWPPLDADRK